MFDKFGEMGSWEELNTLAKNLWNEGDKESLETLCKENGLVGYLLKEARDTDILKESGYTSMGDFAQAEYGISPDQASRFINICEKYGNGEDRLLPQYEGYGYTKLAEMLSLPDLIAEQLTPDITREEIRELKAEVKAEEEITPLEVMMEEPEDKTEGMTLLSQFLFEFFKPEGNAELFANFYDAHAEAPNCGELETDRKVVLDSLAPGGIGILEARIPGKGRYMLSFKGEDASPAFIGIRDDSSEDVSWEDIRYDFDALFIGKGIAEAPGKKVWSALYGAPFPEAKKPESVKSEPENGKNPEKASKNPPKSSKSERKVKIAPAQSVKKESETKEDFMNPPEAAVEDPTPAAAEPEKAEGTVTIEKSQPMSEDERNAKIDETLETVNTLAVNFAGYGDSLERLNRNSSHLFIDNLIFNIDEFWIKLKRELETAERLIKEREAEAREKISEEIST